MLASEMTINLYMFRSLMEDIIVSNLYNTLVVTVNSKQWSDEHSYLQVTNEAQVPQQ